MLICFTVSIIHRGSPIFFYIISIFKILSTLNILSSPGILQKLLSFTNSFFYIYFPPTKYGSITFALILITTYDRIILLTSSGLDPITLIYLSETIFIHNAPHYIIILTYSTDLFFFHKTFLTCL